MHQLHLPDYDARVICDDKDRADYFEKIIRFTSNYKTAANLLLGPIMSYLNENNRDIKALSLKPESLAALITMIENGRLNFSVASQKILPRLISDPAKDPSLLIDELGLVQDSDTANISQWVEEVLSRMPDKVAEYRKGKKGLIGLFVGEVKKISRGKADPKITNDLLLEKLNR